METGSWPGGVPAGAIRLDRFSLRPCVRPERRSSETIRNVLSGSSAWPDR